MIQSEADLCRFIRFGQMPSWPAGRFQTYFESNNLLIVTYHPYHPQASSDLIKVLSIEYFPSEFASGILGGCRLSVHDKASAMIFLTQVNSMQEPLYLEEEIKRLKDISDLFESVK